MRFGRRTGLIVEAAEALVTPLADARASGTVTGAAPVASGDTLLLCSDGLHGVLSDAAIAELLQRSNVEEIASELVERALNSGSTDNVTAVVVRKL